jgi:iron complex transport system permease protein
MKSSPASLAGDRSGYFALLALAVALMALVAVSITIGRYALPLATVVDVLRGAVTGERRSPSTADTVMLMIRLPRIATAVMVGAGLAMAGSAFQSLFRNPMASPGLLGVSSGAGFGASIALLLHQSVIVVEAAAFGGGLTAVLAAFLFNRVISGRSIVTLILCGMVMSALFQALITLVKYVADPSDVLATITFWLMGSLAKAGSADALTVAAPVLLCGFLLYLNRWRISLLALGDHEASSLGVDVRATRLVTIICATVISAATVSVAGIVGWVGLLIPHVARILFGVDPSRLFPATALLGAGFLLAIDDLARCMPVIEVPLGALTAIFGAPFFFFLLLRYRNGHWA